MSNEIVAVLSNSKPTQTASITIPAGSSLSITVHITNGAPNSMYYVHLPQGITGFMVHGNGEGTVTVTCNAIQNIQHSETIPITITGPGISSQYLLTLKITTTGT